MDAEAIGRTVMHVGSIIFTALIEFGVICYVAITVLRILKDALNKLLDKSEKAKEVIE